MQEVQGHSIAPDGCPALDDDERAAEDFRLWRQRLGGGDGGSDGDGVDDVADGYFLSIL